MEYHRSKTKVGNDIPMYFIESDAKFYSRLLPQLFGKNLKYPLSPASDSDISSLADWLLHLRSALLQRQQLAR